MGKPESERAKKRVLDGVTSEQSLIQLFGREPDDLNDPSLFVNRELSLLEFQRRVLEEAQDDGTPLLERVRFLSILFGNLSEFFMVRVAGLKKQVLAGVAELSPDGMTPAEQLAAIRKSAALLMAEGLHLYKEELQPGLDEAGIHILDYEHLTKSQREYAESYFREFVYPVVTPLAYDPGRPFPHISNLSLNLAVIIRDRENLHHFARLKVPKLLQRLVPLKHSSGGHRRDGTVPRNHYFVWLEQLIIDNLDQLFPGMSIVEVHPFHVTRDADMVIQELEASDLLETVEESIRRRRFGSVVRMIVKPDISESCRDILLENLEVDPLDVYTLDGPLALSSLSALSDIERADLKYPTFVPRVPEPFRDMKEGQVFEVLQRQDVLVHHPYDSFKPVVDFLDAAADDPHVLAIKQTLYRVGPRSPVVAALQRAVLNGKQVSVLVELQARFDEESNIEWVRMLEQDGVHVVYGFLGVKTHSKVTLVVRREGGHIRRYMHLATGNYNQVTAQQYEDIGLFTADEKIAEDVTDLFNYLTGYSYKEHYNKLIVAPVQMRNSLEALIAREIGHARAGGKGHIIFKTNSLVDKAIIKSLYEASRAGVTVDLLIRGICCLRPGVPKISENIRVVSILGRFLEHSRFYYFHNSGKEEIYLGSADLMPRNLDHRVELLFPLDNAELIKYVRDEVAAHYLADNCRARIMRYDGAYERVRPETDEAQLDVQARLLSRTKLEIL